MRIDLNKYLKAKYEASLSVPEFAGPVVTISREHGCPAKRVAIKMTNKLNEMDYNFAKKIPWKWTSKEILEVSARELGVEMAEIQYISEYKSHGVITDLLLSHSKKYYKTDRKVRNTIAKVIRNYSEEGNKIIVGLGGVAITRDIPKSLHIFLEAPLEWRALRISEKNSIPIEKARITCIDIDKKREYFKGLFHGRGSDYTRCDISLNCMMLDINEISEIIIGALKIRKII